LCHHFAGITITLSRTLPPLRQDAKRILTCATFQYLTQLKNATDPQRRLTIGGNQSLTKQQVACGAQDLRLTLYPGTQRCSAHVVHLQADRGEKTRSHVSLVKRRAWNQHIGKSGEHTAVADFEGIGMPLFHPKTHQQALARPFGIQRPIAGDECAANLHRPKAVRHGRAGAGANVVKVGAGGVGIHAGILAARVLKSGLQRRQPAIIPAMGDTYTTSATAAQAFITRWRGVTASELSTAQSFVIDLCALLDLAKPHPTPEQDYMFERPVTFRHGDGSTSAGRIDCYRQGAFCLESKKLKTAGHTKGFDDGLLRARSQAENYARALPASEGRPPFVLVVDVGNVIEVYAEFSQSGGTYTPFPDPRSHRIRLDDLAKKEIRERLRQIWLDPQNLNPARISARVTRQVADLLARLAKSIESNSIDQQNQLPAHIDQAQVAPEKVASFLTRCLFSMFAEDVGLLPKEAFIGLLKTHRTDPPTLRLMLQSLWADMDRGGFSPALAAKVLHFNGKLFKEPTSDGYSLLLKKEQIDLLIEAAGANWREVEPAIFGTLLERALNPTERHALGAHYTPRAYVERLVLPTVVEPLRAEWANAQAAALVLAHEAADLEGKPALAKGWPSFAASANRSSGMRPTRRFHHRLCSVRVLDPACGSGNFLYVTLEHLKRLEGRGDRPAHPAWARPVASGF
jgi:hypothetical protein